MSSLELCFQKRTLGNSSLGVTNQPTRTKEPLPGDGIAASLNLAHRPARGKKGGETGPSSLALGPTAL
jgi:hypothetical protein